MKRFRFVSPIMFTLTVTFFSSGCESVALVGRPTLPLEAGTAEIELVGQVDGLDLGERIIFIATRTGERRRVRYDAGTRVLIAGREYPVTGLRVGDRVTLQLFTDERGNTYTDLVRVRSDSHTTAGILEGRVERTRTDLGFLEVRSPSGELTRVYLPYNPTQVLNEAFRRIRTGHFVRVEGSYIGDGRFELVAFL